MGINSLRSCYWGQLEAHQGYPLPCHPHVPLGFGNLKSMKPVKPPEPPQSGWVYFNNQTHHPVPRELKTEAKVIEEKKEGKRIKTRVSSKASPFLELMAASIYSHLY